jgi:hypothetical protein
VRFQGQLRVDLQGDGIRYTTLVILFSIIDVDTGEGLVLCMKNLLTTHELDMRQIRYHIIDRCFLVLELCSRSRHSKDPTRKCIRCKKSSMTRPTSSI